MHRLGSGGFSADLAGFCVHFVAVRRRQLRRILCLAVSVSLERPTTYMRHAIGFDLEVT